MAPGAPAATNLTIEEFLLLETPEGKAELVRGELRLSPPPSGRHGIIWANLTALLQARGRHARCGENHPGILLSRFRAVRRPRLESHRQPSRFMRFWRAISRSLGESGSGDWPTSISPSRS